MERILRIIEDILMFFVIGTLLIGTAIFVIICLIIVLIIGMPIALAFIIVAVPFCCVTKTTLLSLQDKKQEKNV